MSLLKIETIVSAGGQQLQLPKNVQGMNLAQIL